MLGVVRSAGGEAHDASVAGILLEVGRSGAWSTASDWSKELLAAAPRALLRRARAEILLERGLLDGEVTVRQAALTEAAGILEALLASEGPPPGTAHLTVRVLAAAGELAATDEERKTLYVQAVATAAQDEDVASAKLGLEVADRLQLEPLVALLTEAEVASLTEVRRVLLSRLGS